MKTTNKSNKKIQLILILTFVVLAAVLFFMLDNRKKHNQQQYLQRITEQYELAYKTIYSQHKRLAATLQSWVMDRFEIKALYQELATADEAQKNRLRQELLVKLMPRYKMFQKSAQLRQMHFHLKNNESFLRLHRPDKFGDNLTGTRETVAYVNKEHVPIDGFEIGKMYSGYRFVFPITADDKTHLGSLEMSFGPESLTSDVMEQYGVLCNFLIDKKIIVAKTFLGERIKNFKESPLSNYLFDNKVVAELEKISSQEIKKLRPYKVAASEMSSNTNSD